MSLNKREFEQTQVEMARNFELLDRSPEKIADDLGFSMRELKHALAVTPHYSPVNVWKLRDYLEEKILAEGKTPYPFSILTTNIYYPYEKNWQ
ncbi:hypothetical protein RU97_GL002258 [Enterococcus canis]|uniref:DUF2316 family protein n=1 Tax=Enterococcus canis TaxID=214095 RepID=A0A1L8RES4_9ENTE|nr:DUF2316 family protein [Enterococcus canis]OJG18185.1 hypothetical protein RU97_GL002258 [Enterococcus canis]